MAVDMSTMILIGGGAGTFAAALVAGVIKFLPKLWNGKVPIDPQMLPLPRRDIEGTYVRKDTCDLEHRHVNEMLTEVRRDVRLLVMHFDVQPPDDWKG